MPEVANWPPLPRRQIQLMNHPANKQKTTLKHLSLQQITLKIKQVIEKKEILRWEDVSGVLRLGCKGFDALILLPLISFVINYLIMNQKFLFFFAKT